MARSPSFDPRRIQARNRRRSSSTSSDSHLHATGAQTRLRRPLTTAAEAGLVTAIHKEYGWEPRSFQLAGIKAQLEGQDAIIQAPTGSGKTAIVAGPYILKENREKCTIMVVPLLALQAEMVSVFLNDFSPCLHATTDHHI